MLSKFKLSRSILRHYWQNKAEFEVISINPYGSGMDFDNHVGAVIKHAQRCCKNCSVIFGIIGEYEEIGFLPDEVKPLNAEAEAILLEIKE